MNPMAPEVLKERDKQKQNDEDASVISNLDSSVFFDSVSDQSNTVSVPSKSKKPRNLFGRLGKDKKR